MAESPQRDARLVLKIADFGLSACCAGNENQDAGEAVELDGECHIFGGLNYWGFDIPKD